MKNASSYSKLSPIEHVLTRPVMYVGSVERVTRRDWCLQEQTASIVKTDTPVSVLHLFKEVVSNVGDNAVHSVEQGIDPGKCTIKIEGARITVSNEGLSIPIEKNAEGILIPISIFSEMLSGSSLGETRTAGGAHGIGIKAVGILSNHYSVRILNPVQRRSFFCTWKNNLKDTTGPEIKRYNGTESLVEVSYVIDHKRFNYKERTFSYSDLDISMFKWVAACLSFTAQIPVHFNREVLQYDLLSYARLYTTEETDYFTIEKDNVRCIVLDTPQKGKQIGFCNHIINSSGGVHVAAPLKLIKQYLVDRRKSKKSNGQEDKDQKISLVSLKPHITVITSITGIENPEFGGGQTKTSMTAPKVTVTCSDKLLSKVNKWGLIKQLDVKIFAKLGVIPEMRRKGKYMESTTGDDATLIDQLPQDCRLRFFEGESAEGYGAILLDYVEGGRKLYGDFVMRGKLLNVLKASDEKIRKNREINEMVARLGLKMGADYSLASARKALRYGGAIIMADADEDGNHIRALLITFFHRFFPALLEMGFVVDYMTPYLRATKGSQYKPFYFEKQYNDWKAVNNLKGWQIAYYKGLGRSQAPEIKLDYQNKKEVTMIYDEHAAEKLALVMGAGEEATDLRKAWMKEYSPNTSMTIGKQLNISSFLDYFMRNYSHSTLKRNMNTLADGLTHVVRKIVYGAFHVFGRSCTSKKLERVTDFAGKVGEITKYHHGISIQGSVTHLAQDFPGTNNLPLLIGKGRFGTIEKGGKHAAEPRYVEVVASPLLPLIFRPDDDKLLTLAESEGLKVEPEFYLPIVPLALINGCNSVCTGWKTDIPNYNPLELIDALLHRLVGRRFREPVPWYRGYRGTILLEGNTLISRGIVKWKSDNSYVLTCLPVGVWNNSYKEKLMKWVLEDKIEGYVPDCTATKTWFSVTGWKSEDGARPTLKEIKAETRENLTNLTLLGTDGLPIEYYNVKAILEDFYQFRLPFFDKRREVIVAELHSKLALMKERKMYIDACIRGDLQFQTESGQSKKRTEILERIAELGLRKEFYVPVVGSGITPVPLHKMDSDGVAPYMEKIYALEREIELVASKTAEMMWKDDLERLRAAYLTMYEN